MCWPLRTWWWRCFTFCHHNQSLKQQQLCYYVSLLFELKNSNNNFCRRCTVKNQWNLVWTCCHLLAAALEEASLRHRLTKHLELSVIRYIRPSTPRCTTSTEEPSFPAQKEEDLRRFSGTRQPIEEGDAPQRDTCCHVSACCTQTVTI